MPKLTAAIAGINDARPNPRRGSRRSGRLPALGPPCPWRRAAPWPRRSETRVHQRPRGVEGVEKLDRLFAAVAGEVAVVAVDHREAGAQTEAVTGWCGSRGGQLVAATDEVRRLGGVAGQPDGPVVRRPRLLAPAQPAQQVGAGGVEGVVALQRQTVNLGQRTIRAVDLGDRDRASNSKPAGPHHDSRPSFVVHISHTSAGEARKVRSMVNGCWVIGRRRPLRSWRCRSSAS
jgi:hypothetical protein